MSISTEEYLEALYTLTQDGKKAGTTAISKRLNIAPPSVTQMVKKLAGTGYVSYSPRHGVTLTANGLEIAEKMVRKHRLLESFLHNTLHIGNDKVHNEACAMEHALSDETERALCQTLKAPDKCPDDEKVIPPCNLSFCSCDECRKWGPNNLEGIGKRNVNMVPLSALKENQEGTIAFIRGDSKGIRRLLDMGLTCGTKIKISTIASPKGQAEIIIRGSKLALGNEALSNVFVEKSSKEILNVSL